MVKLFRNALLATAAFFAMATPALSFSGGEAYVCRLNPYGDNFLSLRTCPSTRCEEIKRLGPNTRLLLIDPAGRWYKVRLEGYPRDPDYTGISGFVHGRYVCERY